MSIDFTLVVWYNVDGGQPRAWRRTKGERTMKHRSGNAPKCNECYWYHEKEGNDCLYDGWCTNPYQMTHGINGRKLKKPFERRPVRWQECCRQWEDAEDKTSYFDVITGRYRERSEQLKLEVEK